MWLVPRLADQLHACSWLKHYPLWKRAPVMVHSCACPVHTCRAPMEDWRTRIVSSPTCMAGTTGNSRELSAEWGTALKKIYLPFNGTWLMKVLITHWHMHWGGNVQSFFFQVKSLLPFVHQILHFVFSLCTLHGSRLTLTSGVWNLLLAPFTWSAHQVLLLAVF